jgi:hypothetical protein
MKLELRQILEKYSNIKYHENPSSWSRVVPSGQTDKWTDRYVEANSCFFWERWERGLAGVDIHNFGTKWKIAISCMIFLYFLVRTGKMSNDSH